eukprot:g26442.t1
MYSVHDLSHCWRIGYIKGLNGHTEQRFEIATKLDIFHECAYDLLELLILGPYSYSMDCPMADDADWEALKCNLCVRKFKSKAILQKHIESSSLHKENVTVRDAENKGHVDRDTQNCLLCQRQFQSVALLTKHVLSSSLHQQKLKKLSKDEQSKSKTRPLKRRKSNTTWAMDQSRKRTIYIWDLDETLIVFQSLLDSRNPKLAWDQKEAQDIGSGLEELIFYMCDSHMFFKQIEAIEAPHVDTYTSYDSGVSLRRVKWEAEPAATDDGKPNARGLALRYRAIRDIYQTQSLSDLLPEAKLEKLNSLLKRLDKISDGWLAKARAALDSVDVRCGSVNVVVSSGQLTPTLAKLMLFGLSKYFKVRHVYSSKANGKKWCFEQIVQAFGHCVDRVHYRVVGDSAEEREACAELQAARDERLVQEPLFSFCQISGADQLLSAADITVSVPRCVPLTNGDANPRTAKKEVEHASAAAVQKILFLCHVASAQEDKTTMSCHGNLASFPHPSHGYGRNATCQLTGWIQRSGPFQMLSVTGPAWLGRSPSDWQALTTVKLSDSTFRTR